MRACSFSLLSLQCASMSPATTITVDATMVVDIAIIATTPDAVAGTVIHAIVASAAANYACCCQLTLMLIACVSHCMVQPLIG